MNGEQAYKFAYANAERNAYGIVEESLVKLVAHAVDFDAEKERLGLAQRIVSRRKRPGQTDPEGKVCIPGLEPYAWEPHRLIADDDGNVVENKDARQAHKQAEARRAKLAAESAQERAQREQYEADLIAGWTAIQQAAGRDPRTLTFATCLAEAGVLDGGAA